MKNIYGSIGYTLLRKDNLIIIFADKHDEIPDCTNSINMADWLKTKFKTSIILLEEVPRIPNNKLVELWDQSVHTRQLKDIYLQNSSIIKPVDIRHFLIPFSWELIDKKNEYDITLEQYLLDIDRSLSMRNKYLIKKCSIYDAKILKNIKPGRHFLDIKDKFNQLIMRATNLNILKTNILQIKLTNESILENINDLISMIMEWYICACVYQYKDQPLIIHVGLAHSEQIVKLLNKTYDYNIVEQQGINKLIEITNDNLSGCVQISDKLNSQFGGYL